MADLQQYVRKQIDETIKTAYPHLRLPAAAQAVITQTKEAVAGGVYRLRILDCNGQIDETVPEIPEVKSGLALAVGDTVCVLLLYGQLHPYIVGRCEA